MSEERTDCLKHDGVVCENELVIKYPFAGAYRADWGGPRGYYLFINVFSYEGPVKNHIWDGRGYPWIEINVYLPDESLIAMLRKVYGRDNRPAILLHGKEWDIVNNWGDRNYGKISLSNHKEYIEDLVPGKFYCLDTGKILDLSKLKKPSA